MNNIDFRNTSGVYWGVTKIKEVYYGATKLWEEVKMIEIAPFQLGVGNIISKGTNGWILFSAVARYIQSKGVSPEQVNRIYSPKGGGHTWDVIITQEFNGEYTVRRSDGGDVYQIGFNASFDTNSPNEFFYD